MLPGTSQSWDIGIYLRCSALQCVAACCSVLQSVATLQTNEGVCRFYQVRLKVDLRNALLGRPGNAEKQLVEILESQHVVAL